MSRDAAPHFPLPMPRLRSSMRAPPTRQQAFSHRNRIGGTRGEETHTEGLGKGEMPPHSVTSTTSMTDAMAVRMSSSGTNAIDTVSAYPMTVGSNAQGRPVALAELASLTGTDLVVAGAIYGSSSFPTVVSVDADHHEASRRVSILTALGSVSLVLRGAAQASARLLGALGQPSA